ncbi:MAG: LytR C-terminal domain-containing protein [Nocardioides sp.]|nr:LytR C-terminal domain-containing protein [Nocardioides sp.]
MLDSALHGLRTFIIMAVLVVLVALAFTWGWKAMTAPFPQKVAAPPCVQTKVKQGDKVYPSQVVVSVLNASSRSGLAGRAMSTLTDKGFVKGSTNNAPSGTKVEGAEVWTSDPSSPAAQLVASWLGNAKIVRGTASSPGITVVAGPKLGNLTTGKKYVVATKDGEICSPPVD